MIKTFVQLEQVSIPISLKVQERAVTTYDGLISDRANMHPAPFLHTAPS